MFLHCLQTYDGAFAQLPGLESHGGSTYCCVAALALCQRLGEITDRECVVQWLLNRQIPTSGFQGRPNKDADVCYSFWCGASLQVC